MHSTNSSLSNLQGIQSIRYIISRSRWIELEIGIQMWQLDGPI